MKNAERLSGGLESWLVDERSSAEGMANRLFADYDRAAEGLKLPYEDPNNILASKAISHSQRFWSNHLWVQGALETPSHDYLAGRMMFACMMRVSGARNLIGHVLADNQEEFYSIRIGTDKYRTTEEIITARVSELTGMHVNEDVIAATNSKTMEVSESTFRGLSGRDTRDVLTSQELNLARDFEKSTLDTLVDYAVFFSQFRQGDIQLVPSLEPKSITLEPAVVYPFE
jgi:hypothetical protein